MKRLSALVVGLAVVVPVTAQDMGTISVMGEDVRVFAAGDPGSDRVVLITHDWFGMTEFLQETTAAFGDKGYYAVAVDLYDGESAVTHAQAGQLMQRLNGAAGPARDRLDGLVSELSEGRRLGVLGFSMGGDWAFATALRNPEHVDAAVVVYGGGMDAHADSALAGLEFAPLFVTGSADAWALNSMTALLPRLESARGAELYVYPGARHAYAQPLFAEGDNLDAEATRLTWMLVEDYLERMLD